MATKQAKSAVMKNAAAKKFKGDAHPRIPAGQSGGGRFTSASISQSGGTLTMVSMSGSANLSGEMAKQWSEHLASTYGLKGSDMIRMSDDDFKLLKNNKAPNTANATETKVEPTPRKATPQETKVEPTPPPKAETPKETKVKPSTVPSAKQAIVERAAIAAKKVAEEKRVADAAKKVADDKKAADAAKKVAEEKRAADAAKKAADTAKRVAEEKAAETAKKVSEEKAAIAAKKVAEEKKAKAKKEVQPTDTKAKASTKETGKVAPLQFKSEAEANAWFKENFSSEVPVKIEGLSLADKTLAASTFNELSIKTGISNSELMLQIKNDKNEGSGSRFEYLHFDMGYRSMRVSWGSDTDRASPENQKRLEELKTGKFAGNKKEQAHIDKALTSMRTGKRDYAYSTAGECFENNGEFVIRHEFGHYFHHQNNKAVVERFGKNASLFAPDVNYTEAFNDEHIAQREKYRVSTYGTTQFMETIAENFALYSANKLSHMHPDMIEFFRENTSYGY
jgi:hypothetical protein